MERRFSPPVPWRDWMANGLFVSAAYLALGVSLEAVRRWRDVPWAERASLALDGLPARILNLGGLLGPLRDLYRDGSLSHLWLRIVFGAVTVGLILLVAMLTGLTAWILGRPWRRAPPH